MKSNNIRTEYHAAIAEQIPDNPGGSGWTRINGDDFSWRHNQIHRKVMFLEEMLGKAVEDLTLVNSRRNNSVRSDCSYFAQVTEFEIRISIAFPNTLS